MKTLASALRSPFRLSGMGCFLIAALSGAVSIPHAAAQIVTSNGTGGGNWGLGSTWSNELVPAPANDFEIVSGDTVVADGNFNFPDLSSLTLNSGGILELEFLPGGAPVISIDSANDMILAGGTLRTSTSDAGATFVNFINGTQATNTGGLQIVADSTIENALSDLTTPRIAILDLEGNGLSIDPGNTGPVTLTVDLNPSQASETGVNRRVRVANGNFAGGADDTISFSGTHPGHQFAIGPGVDSFAFAGTVIANGGASYAINRSGYSFTESVVLGDGTGTSNATRSQIGINADNIAIGSDFVTDNTVGRDDRADPAFNVFGTSQGFTVQPGVLLDDWIGGRSNVSNGNSSASFTFGQNSTIGGLTDLTDTISAIGTDPRETWTIGTGDVPSTVSIIEDAFLESSVISLEVFDAATSDVIDGLFDGTLQLGLTGNNVGGTPFPTLIEIELEYSPLIGDSWVIFENWGTIDEQQLDLVADSNGHSLPAGASLAFTVEDGGATGRVTVIPEPSRVTLMLCGAVCLLLCRRRP